MQAGVAKFGKNMQKIKEDPEGQVLLYNLKSYMCAIQNLNFKWMNDVKEGGQVSLTTS